MVIWKRVSALAKATKRLPALWLFKEEPNHYSFDDLCADRQTVWDGVTNNLARQNLRKVARGDRILYYHTGNEKAIVGEMVATTNPFVPEGSDDPKAVAVKVKAVKRWPKPVTLARIKQEASLADWQLVRLSRLSVVPVTEEQWNKVEELGRV
jgi:predicted RNA-binding protein with PUA-like domain